MLDLHTQALGVKPIPWDAAPVHRAPAPAASDAAATPMARWYELMLDEIGYGVLLLDGDAQAARRPDA